MVGPARLAERRTQLPVYTFQSEAGVPPMGVLRIDEDALASVDGRSHVHDFPGIVYFEGDGGGIGIRGECWRFRAGDAFLIRPGELVEIDSAHELAAARGWGLYFTPSALAGTAYGGPGPVDQQLAWRVHPLLHPFATSGIDPVRLRVPEERRPIWTTSLATIEREMRERREGYRQAALANLVILLVDVGRLVDPPARTGGGQDLIDRVFSVIEARYRDALSLADVAAALHVSPGHLTTTLANAPVAPCRTGSPSGDWSRRADSSSGPTSPCTRSDAGSGTPIRATSHACSAAPTA